MAAGVDGTLGYCRAWPGALAYSSQAVVQAMGSWLLHDGVVVRAVCLSVPHFSGINR